MEIAQDAYAKHDFPKALDHFLAAAQAGDANAEYYAAAMYSVGDGARKDFPKAVKMFESAAEKEQPDALYALARLYIVGDGVPRNPERALAFYDRAIAAYPPGEARDAASEQRTALANVLTEQGKLPSTQQPEAAQAAAKAAAAPKAEVKR
jgi:TPR repeat protein